MYLLSHFGKDHELMKSNSKEMNQKTNQDGKAMVTGLVVSIAFILIELTTRGNYDWRRVCVIDTKLIKNNVKLLGEDGGTIVLILSPQAVKCLKLTLK